MSEVLAILDATRDQWLTVSDIAFWTYGDDTELERHAVRNILTRLPQYGHTVIWRYAPWVFSRGGERAYRLISEPSSRTQEAA